MTSEQLRSLPMRILTPAVALGMIGAGTIILLAGEPIPAPAGRPERPAVGGPGLTEIPIGGEPLHVAYGEDRVWVIRSADDALTLVQIDPASNSVVGEPIPLEQAAWGLSAGEGAVWVVSDPSDPDVSGSSLLRIDPATGQPTDTVAVGKEARGVALGFDSVWVTSQADGTLVRIDPATAEVAETIEIGDAPGPVASGTSGVWVTTRTDEGPVVVRVSPGSNSVAAEIDGVELLGVGGTFVWARDDAAIVRIQPKTNQVVGDPLPIEAQPAFATTLEGAVWVAKWFRVNGIPEPDRGAFKLFRLNVKRMTMATEPLTIDWGPTRPVAGGNALWIGSTARHAVLRVDPAAVPPIAARAPTPVPTPT
jgi:hypothetical protein